MIRKTGIRLILPLMLGITACATKPAVPSSQLKEQLTNSFIIIAPIQKPARLTERTKAQAIGNMVISSVAGSIAVNSGYAANMQQLQANAELGRNFSQQLNQALPATYTVESGKGADLALAKKLSDFFGIQAKPQSPKEHELYISVTTRLWELGYTSLLTSQNYALTYDMDLNIQQKQDDKLKSVKTIGCAGTAKEKMPLEEWKTDDYKKVNASAEIIVNECFNKFLAETGFH